MGKIGNGVYSLQEAARLTGLRPQRVREWFLGRASEQSRKPVFRGDYRPILGDHAVSFHDLIELFVAGQLREHGVSLQSLRIVHSQMQKYLGSKHPFCRKEFLSDGEQILTLGLSDQGREEKIEPLGHQRGDRAPALLASRGRDGMLQVLDSKKGDRALASRGREEMNQALSHRRVFANTLLPFLRRISYDEATQLARKWAITDMVVIDPSICLGKPVVEPVGMTTWVLASAYHANRQDAEVVAEWYKVHARHVLAAVEFERRLAA